MESSLQAPHQKHHHLHYHQGDTREVPVERKKFSDFITLSVSDVILKKLSALLRNVIRKRSLIDKRQNRHQEQKQEKKKIPKTFNALFKELKLIAARYEMKEFSKPDLKRAGIELKRKTPSPPIDILGEDESNAISKRSKVIQKKSTSVEHRTKSAEKTFTPPNMATNPSFATTSATSSSACILATNMQSAPPATTYFDPFETPTKIIKRTDPLRISQPTRGITPKKSQLPISPQPEISFPFGPLSTLTYSGRRFTGISPIDDYVGEGTFGEVHRARHRITGRLVALKRILPMPHSDGVMREISTLKRLSNHPNIISLLEMAVSHKTDTTCFFLVFPYLEHDLVGLLDAPSIPPFTIPQIKYYAIELLQGISHMHQHGLLHRDVKSANVLVGNKGEVKIADFGLARTYDTKRQLTMTPGVVTRWYRPPELLLGASEYTTAIDVWGIGCIIAELILREPLFQGKSEIHQLTLIFDELGWPTPDMRSLLELPEVSKLPALEDIVGKKSEGFSPMTRGNSEESVLEQHIKDVSLLALVRRLLGINPKQRISAKEALKHPALTTSLPLPATASELPFFGNTSFHELEKRQRDASRKSAPSSTASIKMVRIEKNELARVECPKPTASPKWEDPPKDSTQPWLSAIHAEESRSDHPSTEKFAERISTDDNGRETIHSENKSLADRRNETEKESGYSSWGDFHSHHRTFRPELKQFSSSIAASQPRHRYHQPGRRYEAGYGREMQYRHRNNYYPPEGNNHYQRQQYHHPPSRYYQRPPPRALSRERDERFRRPLDYSYSTSYRRDSPPHPSMHRRRDSLEEGEL